MTSIFVTVTGQDDNLGDSLLRRGYLQALRRIGRLHVFVGGNSKDYISGLGLQGDDALFRDHGRWMRRLFLEAAALRQPVLALNAGEAQVNEAHHYASRRIRLMGRAVQGMRGTVVQAGLGVREGSTAHPSPPLVGFLKRADLVTWRDADSANALGIGVVQPDWAFALEGVATGQHAPSRTILAITMRGDRPFPQEAWFKAVARLQAVHSLRIVVSSQVRRDNDRAEAIATRIGAEATADAWSSGDHAARLEHMAALYTQSRAVVSDRLHALALGALNGAAPIGLSTGSADKLRRTLAPVGLATQIYDAGSLDTLDVPPLPSSEQVAESVASARDRLARVASEIERIAGHS